MVPYLDLTFFGFTPTESHAYRVLLERGPLNGYALAKALGIARANAYQALHGLESKGAARATGDEPRRYRPIAPDALFAQIVNRECSALDALEISLRGSPADQSPEVLRLTGQRSVEELVLRSAVRSKHAVECLGSGAFLERLAPAWHKRAADNADTRLWVVGDGGDALPIRPTARLDAESLTSTFGGVPILFWAGSTGIAAMIQQPGGDIHGYWSNDPLFLALIRAAMRLVTA